MAVSAKAHGGRNWRRIFFYVVEVVFAIIAGTGEAYMYAAYLPNGWERWPEAIARATITQVVIVLFGVAAIEVWRIRNGFARIFVSAVIWAVTIGAGCLTFWFLWEAGQVFRDRTMLAPLDGAAVTFPWGWVIPNWMIDVALIAALPFFQTALNILGPVITADHAPESQEELEARHAREEAEAAHKARMAEHQGAGWGARIGAGWRTMKTQATGDQTGGNDDQEPADNVSPFPQVASGETGGFGSRAPNSQSGARGAGGSIRKGQWTSTNLREYALSEYGVNVSPDAAQAAMSALATMGKAKKQANRYVASQQTVKAWVDQKYGATQATGTTNQ